MIYLGNWTIGRKVRSDGRHTYWECTCKCGNKKTIRSDQIALRKSCGCIKTMRHNRNSKSDFIKNILIDDNGCWIWQGKPMKSGGYGRFSHDNRRYRAHVYSYELHNGIIPSGLCVLHSCDVPLCVNPDHLFLGTQSDNNLDMRNKGRARGMFVQGQNLGEKHPMAKLTSNDVVEIRKLLSTQQVSLKDMSEKFGVNTCTIYAIKQRNLWSHI